MASRIKILIFVVAILSVTPFLEGCDFDSIYQLGDSIADTGNLIREQNSANTPCINLPYGKTFFGKATGRCSDGRVMLDFIAWAAGIPFINSYKDVKANHANGVNFAVSGSTALSRSTLARYNIIPFVTNSSLNVQLGWMSRHFSSLCNTNKDCREKFKNSLFMVGEIGGNDYNFALNPRTTIEEISVLVPNVVQAIIKATKRVIKHYGASKVVVPGNFPIGCFPIYQTLFQTNVSEAYDSNHCLKDLNNLAENHNELLQEKLAKLQKERPGTTIMYGDYYNAFKWLFTSAPQLSFDATTTQKACCGFGGEYNFNPAYICGDPRVDVPVCSNPSKYISWDGIHLTEAAYQKMTTWLLHNSLSALNCRS